MTVQTREDVLRIAEERNVQFIRLWFTDILGTLKSFAITRDELEDALDGGMGFDGSSITGYQDIEESDMIAMPDISTFKIIPWSPQDTPTARMICDIQTPDGDPYVGDPRYVLRRALERAKEMGFDHFYVGPELEYFYFKSQDNPEPLDYGSYFDLTTLDAATALRRETIFALQSLDIDVEYSHHEVGVSQHEIDLRFDDALKMADTVMTYKTVVKEIATNHGVYATFMPKPLRDSNGSGMHTHQSLFSGDRNAFFDPNDEYFLSKEAKSFVAGQLRHAREISIIFAQYVNSYKRLVPGYEAPVYIAWSRRNRSALVRV
ncbi:MAG: glutamine synthetase family protein, partial [Rubrobacteraceae bacterium]|nr:glutamine synthetase family protein [Rubrobacteraceae bacterium]